MGNRERAKVDHAIKKKYTDILYSKFFSNDIFIWKNDKIQKKNKVIIIIIGKENHNRYFVNNY